MATIGSSNIVCMLLLHSMSENNLILIPRTWKSVHVNQSYGRLEFRWRPFRFFSKWPPYVHRMLFFMLLLHSLSENNLILIPRTWKSVHLNQSYRRLEFRWRPFWKIQNGGHRVKIENGTPSKIDGIYPTYHQKKMWCFVPACPKMVQIWP